MPIAEVRSQVFLNNLLKGVAQLDTNDLEQFVSRVLTLRARRIAPSLSKQEAEMLEKINQGLPPDTQRRCNELTEKRQTETLTREEQQELLVLIEHIELADAERVQALIRLAQLRNVSVTALMSTLNIHQPAYG